MSYPVGPAAIERTYESAQLIHLRHVPGRLRVHGKEQPDADGNVELMIKPGAILDRVRLHFSSYVGEFLAEPGSDKREHFFRRFRSVAGGSTLEEPEKPS